MIQLITFDLDDTLWDVRPALIRGEQAQNTWLEQHYPQAMAGMDDATLLARKRALIEAEPQLKHHISQFRKSFIAGLLTDIGIGQPEAEHAAEQAFQRFMAHRLDVDIFPETLAALDALKPQYRLASLTNGNADVGQTALGPYFEFQLRAEQVGAAKPDPALFLEVMRQAGVTAHQAVHVGDSYAHDIVGAHNAGIRAVWLTQDNTDPGLASVVIEDIGELPQAIASLECQD